MEDIFYSSFAEEWVPKQANILADLEYQRNLADHLVTTEVMYMKLNGILAIGTIADDDIQKWQVLGFTILSLQHRIYNIIPDFASKQRSQLLALSKEVIKEERFHNDTVLSRNDTLSEDDFLTKLKSYHVLIKEAIITSDKTLKIVLNNYVPETLQQTATFLAREVDAHGIGLKSLMLYDQNGSRILKDIVGNELFIKPL